MSLESHTLSTGGTTKTLADWGAVSAIHKHQAGGDDSLTITLRRDLDDVDVFPPLQPVILYDPSGTERWRGTWVVPEQQASAKSERQIVKAEGPDYYLKRHTFTQQWQIAIDPTTYTGGGGTVPQNLPQGVLNLNGSSEQITARTQIQAALDDAVAGGAPIAYAFDDGPFGSGLLMQQLGNTFLPDDKVMGMHTSEIIQRCLTWMPCIGRSWRYGGAPVCFFASELNPANTVGVQGSVQPINTLDLTDGTRVLTARPVARYDLLVGDVKVYYLGQIESTNSSGQIIMWRNVLLDESTVDNGAFGSEEIVIESAASVYGTGGRIPFDALTIVGLSKILHAPFANLYFDLEWKQQGNEVDWSILPGTLWNATGGSAQLAASANPVQVITRDIGASTTTVKCGAPHQVSRGFRAWRDIRRGVRSRTPAQPGDKSSQQYGFGDQGDDKLPAEGFFKTIQYCDSTGANQSWQFWGKNTP